LIDREYYPLETATRVLGCAEDDLIHLAANDKLVIYLLTDDFTYGVRRTVEYGVKVENRTLFPKLVPVTKTHWVNLEAGIELTLTVTAPDENLKPEIWYAPFYDFCDDPIFLNKLVVLHDDLMRIANGKADKINEFNLSSAERTSMLKLVLGMAIDAYGYNPNATKNKATGENNGSIKAALDRLGISIDADTIRKYLNEAKDLLPPPAQ